MRFLKYFNAFLKDFAGFVWHHKAWWLIPLVLLLLLLTLLITAGSAVAPFIYTLF